MNLGRVRPGFEAIIFLVFQCGAVEGRVVRAGARWLEGTMENLEGLQKKRTYKEPENGEQMVTFAFILLIDLVFIFDI